MNYLTHNTPEFFQFIEEHKKSDVSSLMLKYHDKHLPFDLESAFIQIKCRQKTSGKLSIFIENENFLFPSVVSAEQASHQAVAIFHASLLPDNATLLDMTAGLGIDVMTMAKKCSNVTAVEIDPIKSDYLDHNKSIMNLDNLLVFNADSVEWLKNHDGRFDIIFIDPARRDSENKRTYNFHDCLPDIIAIQEMLRDKGSIVFIKASPLLDITQTLRDISLVRSIRAVCVEGECKEILVETGKQNNDIDRVSEIIKEAVDLNNKGDVISSFSYREICNAETDMLHLPYAEEYNLIPGNYLYEPNAAMMKLAPWRELCLRFPDLKKLAPSSQLFVSEALYTNFPGRILKIEKLIEKKDRKVLKGLPANVVVRNYPVSAENLRKQLGVKEGSDTFIYGTRLKNPVLLLAKRVKI